MADGAAPATVAGERDEPRSEAEEDRGERVVRSPGRGARGGRTSGRAGARRGTARHGAGRRYGREAPEPEDEPVAELEARNFDEEEGDELPPPEQPRERDAEAEQLVSEILDYFLATMGVVAETYVRDELEDGSLVFEIEGEDAGLLIGRRGETLQALQFLVRMVVNRQLGRKAYILIDVEDYRKRRADMLRRLARRTAGRVATSGRSVALDPMSPGERRIVHMSLANHPRVRTESEGEGNQRRVVLMPRR